MRYQNRKRSNNGFRYPWLWALIGFLTLIGIVVAARRYFVLMSPSIGADSVNPAKDLDANFARHRGLTLAHIIPAAFYITLLPFQFANRPRARFSRLHRWNGRVLVGLGAYVAITAFVMSFTMAIGGANESAATALYAVLLLFFLYKGFRAALTRRFSAPRVDGPSLRCDFRNLRNSPYRRSLFRSPSTPATAVLRYCLLAWIHHFSSRR